MLFKFIDWEIFMSESEDEIHDKYSNHSKKKKGSSYLIIICLRFIRVGRRHLSDTIIDRSSNERNSDL